MTGFEQYTWSLFRSTYNYIMPKASNCYHNQEDAGDCNFKSILRFAFDIRQTMRTMCTFTRQPRMDCNTVRQSLMENNQDKGKRTADCRKQFRSLSVQCMCNDGIESGNSQVQD